MLAPAANKEVAIEAIKHGADAIYMGASSHGARKNASNSIEDVAEVVAFAHKFRVKVYVTVNTLVYDSEIAQVEKLIRELYEIGVDALIVQDMGILRMNIPPIELHASTQCDTRTVSKAKFLESAGFSQIVLARELSIKEISEICRAVTVPVECFIHGALCVSYSGRCRASYVQTGRSANRGECSQMCRLPYTLKDADGRTLLKNKYLLSLKDFNASDNVESLIEAGVSSFKIEGRLKDASYVKNITAYYRRLIDSVIEKNPGMLCRSSYGSSIINFIPDPEKSFNRGFTPYFLNAATRPDCRLNDKMASIDTPKSMGERITDMAQLNNGDGISFKNSAGEYEGVRVNKIENGRIIGAKPFRLPPNCEIRRTFNREWQTALEKPTAERVLKLDIEVDEAGISARDERGVEVRILLDAPKSIANKPMQPEKILGKLGSTIYRLNKFENNLDPSTFIQASALTELKRKLINVLDAANLVTYPVTMRREEVPAEYEKCKVGAEENIANRLAESFYNEHGVVVTSRAFEAKPAKYLQIGEKGEEEPVLMTTRYCIRRELGFCKKYPEKMNKDLRGVKEPLFILSGSNKFRLKFDCSRCEMQVIGCKN